MATHRLVLLGLSPVRCLSCLRDAEHAHLPSKDLLVEDIQDTWAPWMINLCKWGLLTPGLSRPCQAKGCCVETATLGVASWPASSLFEGNYGILGTLQVVCSGCCNGDIRGKWRERGQYVLRNYLCYLFIYFWFVCWYVGFVFVFFFFLNQLLTGFICKET